MFEESDYTFGVIRMHYALKGKLNQQINKKRIRRLMRIMGFYPTILKKHS
ncbi:IS3 family transposase [Listeria monocytogenes]|nr:transposase [Listeria monocytogenes]EDN7386673.1 IS3 family transposase [Listeria monocytogenes]